MSIDVSFALKVKGKPKHRPLSQEMKRIEKQTLPSDARCAMSSSLYSGLRTSVSTKEIIQSG